MKIGVIYIYICLAIVQGEDELVGDFKSKDHGVNGTVFLRDINKLLIKGFSYDGKENDLINSNLFNFARKRALVEFMSLQKVFLKHAKLVYFYSVA